MPRMLLIALVSLAAMACGQPAPTSRPAPNAETAPPSAGPKRITVAIRGTAQVLNNKLNIGNAGLGVGEIEKLVHAGLGVQDDLDLLHPTLAEAIPSLENGLWRLLPDGRMETTWRIRDGAEWHDGTPVTTDDLRFTATIARDREIPIFLDPTFDAVERIDAADQRTLTVAWSGPYIQADTLLSQAGSGARTNLSPLPAHLLEPAYLADKANFHQLPYWTGDFVGAGPYRVREYNRDSGLSMVANPRFVLGRPHVDEIDVRFMPDANTIIANILSGVVDLTFDARSISFAQALQIKDQWREGQIRYARATWVTMYPQYLNPTPALVADVRFRRAMIHAIDRQDILDTMQSGVGGVAHHYIGPDWAEYQAVEPAIVRYDYNPRRSAELLESMGYTKGGDGGYADSAGQRLALEIRTTEVDINSKSSFTVADYWQRLGVQTEVAIVPPQRTNDREYRATFPAFELIRPGTQVTSFDVFRSREVPLPENNWAGANRARYRSAELDALIDSYFTTIPVPQRLQTLTQIVHHMTEQLVLMGVVYDPPLRLIANRVRNVSAGVPWNSYEWDVAGGQ